MSAKLDGLRREFEELNAEWKGGQRHFRYRVERAYNAWFRQAVAEGRSPDALVPGTLYGEEQLRHFSVNGAEHIYWTGPKMIRLPEGGQRRVEIFVVELSLGRKISDYHEVIERSCGERKCIRPNHLRIRPKRRQTMSEAECIFRLRAAARHLGRTPTVNDYGTGMPSHVTVAKLFGSFSGGLEAAGLEPRDTRFTQRHTDEDIFAAMRAKAKELGRVPGPGEWQSERWSPAYNTIGRRFRGKGGFATALKLAGLT